MRLLGPCGIDYHDVVRLLHVRDICGTARGYRKHKYLKEEKCQPCRDAYNVFRRSIYSPENNKKHRKTYFSKPEKKEQNRQYHKKFNLSSEERERRREERKAATREKNRILKEAKRQAYLDKIAQQKAERLEKLKQQRLERAKLREERRAQERLGAEIAKIIEKELKSKAREEARQAKEAERRALRAEKARQREELLNQHGTTVGDYDRCRKTNGTACDLCKAVAAEYMRVKSKTPKYKEREREWRRNNPHKAYLSSKDRAKKYGVPSEHYTRQQIFDRDGYDCHICREPVDITATHAQGQPGWERYPHIDHVIPLALGGSDTFDNVKIAHARCNLDKGARLLPDLIS